MSDTSSKLTMNKWLLLLLATVAFGSSGYRQWLQQDWLALGSVVLAWCIVLWLIQRHRMRGAAVLAHNIDSLQARIKREGDHLQIGQERWLITSISQVEMGVIDQQRAYVYITIDAHADVPTNAKQLRKFLIPYAEFQPIQQQLQELLPNVRWLLP